MTEVRHLIRMEIHLPRYQLNLGWEVGSKAEEPQKWKAARVLLRLGGGGGGAGYNHGLQKCSECFAVHAWNMEILKKLGLEDFCITCFGFVL